VSRSTKKQKSAGYEYWSARPGNVHGGIVGKFTKRLTHRAERKINKDATKEIK
jgi:hypothetical protein